MKIYRSLVYLLMAAVLALPLLAGCIGQPPIEGAVLCAAVSKTGEPLLAADNFTPDINTIYCSVKVNAPSAKSTVRADWYLVKSDDPALSNLLIGSEKVPADAPYAVFAFARSESQLPRGDYKVSLFYDDKPMLVAPFVIQGEPAASSAKLDDGAMSTGVDVLSGKPLNKVSVFPVGSPIIHGSARVSGADFNDIVVARWVYEGGELGEGREQKIAELSLKVEGREYLDFSISPKEGMPFPKGRYSLRFYVGDIEQLKLPFSVVEDSELPALYVSEANVYAFKDAEQKEANLTSRFTADTPEIFFRAKIYNAPSGTPMDVQWIIVSSEEAGVEDYQVAEDKNSIDGTLAISARLTAGKEKLIIGDYAVKMLLNGEEKVTIPFKVQ
jgi:hypothetical protein